MLIYQRVKPQMLIEMSVHSPWPPQWPVSSWPAAGVHLDDLSPAPQGVGANIWASHSTAGVSQSRGGAWQGWRCGLHGLDGLDGLDHLESTSRLPGHVGRDKCSVGLFPQTAPWNLDHTQDTDGSGIIIDFTMIYHGLSHFFIWFRNISNRYRMDHTYTLYRWLRAVTSWYLDHPRCCSMMAPWRFAPRGMKTSKSAQRRSGFGWVFVCFCWAGLRGYIGYVLWYRMISYDDLICFCMCFFFFACF